VTVGASTGSAANDRSGRLHIKEKGGVRAGLGQTALTYYGVAEST
jgi:hypothetical protein